MAEVKRLRVEDAELAAFTINTIKPAEERDGHEVAAEYLRTFLADERNVLLAALEDGRPVGMALAYRVARVDRPQQMMMFYEIGVSPASRRRGVGAMLIETLKRICRDHGILKMWVPTNESNTAAMRLYASCGGVRVAADSVEFAWSGSALEAR